MIIVKVPATSANLAVGYDCLGLAINTYARFKFSQSSKMLSITGCPPQYQNFHNLVYRSFQIGCKYLKHTVPGVRIEINSRIPIARGQGSSATCIVAGVMAAFSWFKEPINRGVIFQIATKIEGHPDNVAPAIYGGLCVAFYNQTEGQYQVLNYPVNKNLDWATVVPNYLVSTAKARGILPRSMKYSDVTYQMSHCLLLVHDLQTGNFQQLKEALRDKMQEPYRQKLIKHYPLIKSIVKRTRNTMYISGSGSTLMIISNRNDALENGLKQIHAKFPDYQINPVNINQNGANFQND